MGKSIMNQPRAKEVLEIMSTVNLGVAVGTLTTLGYSESELINMVKANVSKALDAMAQVAIDDAENDGV
jgi:Holliday junction resolvasome RuvABC DNA-binding subunit